jgi:hypothetical protein
VYHWMTLSFFIVPADRNFGEDSSRDVGEE